MKDEDVKKMIDNFTLPSIESHMRGMLAIIITEELEKFAEYVDDLQWAYGRYPNARSLLKDYLKSIKA